MSILNHFFDYKPEVLALDMSRENVESYINTSLQSV